MIPIRRIPLAPATRQVLAGRQRSANKLKPGAREIQHRWNYFLRQDAAIASRNRAALADVRRQLDAMFHGKCCYCEKIIAKDIEHFYPKTLYPARMFAWDNLLRACKDCNFEKHQHDPLDAHGRRTLLDPTVDRPEDYFDWDLLTGAPVYRDRGPGTHPGRRTVAVCGLDNQKFNDQRRKRGRQFLYLVQQVLTETPVRRDTRDLLDDLLEAGEPWLGVIRQIVRDPAQSAALRDVEAKLPHLADRFTALRWTHP